METDLFFVVIILKLLFYKTLWLYLVYLSIALVQYFQNIKKRNIFPPKIPKVFKSIWSALKPTLPFILSVYFVISVPLFILQEAWSIIQIDRPNGNLLYYERNRHLMLLVCCIVTINFNPIKTKPIQGHYITNF